MAFLLLAIIATCCWLVGYGMGRRRMRKQLEAATPKREQLRCDCGHLYTSHEIEAPNKCGATVVDHQYRKCACFRYVGPRPEPTLAELWPEAPKVGE